MIPDGNTIAFLRNSRDVMLVSPLGGPERKLTTASYPQLAWTPDSRRLGIVDREPGQNAYRIYLVSPDDGRRMPVTAPPANSVGDLWFAFSPDAKYLAFVRCADGCDVYLEDGNQNKPQRLTQDQVNIIGLAWTPDSRQVVFSSERGGFLGLWRMNVNPLKAPEAISVPGEEAAFPTIVRTPSGVTRLAYERALLDTNLWALDLERDRSGDVLVNKTPPLRLIASTHLDSSPQYSPDGESLVFVSTRTGRMQLWLSRADGSNQVQLTRFERERPGSPRWSPDGRHIVFDALLRGNRAIYTLDVSTREIQRVTEFGSTGRPSYSRDGRWIYYFSAAGGDWQVMKIPTGSQPAQIPPPVRVTTDGGFEAYESPDGKTLYYTRDRDLWMMPVEGERAARALESPIRHGWWAVHANGLYFVDTEGAGNGGKPIYLPRWSGGAAVRVGTVAGHVDVARPDFCVSPDGRRILYGQMDLNITNLRMIENFR